MRKNAQIAPPQIFVKASLYAHPVNCNKALEVSWVCPEDIQRGWGQKDKISAKSRDQLPHIKTD
jgi:hypothetical protein